MASQLISPDFGSSNTVLAHHIMMVYNRNNSSSIISNTI